jgi:glycosyltransferase involved in cell wall biosynthesis
MKMMVMIPCYNEEATLPEVLRTIPRAVPGIDTIEILVIDDGSSDHTVEVAALFGADHVVRHVRNRGLAAAFQTGLDACLSRGADIIVNTDGDNQYPQADIPRLVEPILRGEADIVIGDRQTGTIEHFSPVKKLLQAFGSWVVRQASGTAVPDAPSGFRAYSREAALRLNVMTSYTYTLETIIQAGKKNLAVRHINIRTNPQTRQSRLIRGVWDYVKKSGATIVRLYALYEPLKVFFYIGLVFLLIGCILMSRFLYSYFILQRPGMTNVQSLVIGSTFINIGALIMAIGLVADLIASSRRLLEDLLYRVKKLELQSAARDEAPAEPEPVVVDVRAVRARAEMGGPDRGEAPARAGTGGRRGRPPDRERASD